MHSFEVRDSSIERFFSSPVFSLNGDERRHLLLPELQRLTKHHFDHCREYRTILNADKTWSIDRLETLPFLPVSLFKSNRLASIPTTAIYRTMYSSGTTSQTPSTIILDRETASLQSRALVKVLQPALGSGRKPMLIVDSPTTARKQDSFSARGAGILGILNFSRTVHYALDDEMTLDFDGLSDFLKVNEGHAITIFGFTFMVWKYFLRAIQESGMTFDLSNATLVHSGGWKNLRDEGVDNREFRSRLSRQLGISRIFNYYGMVEQVGSVFLEGEDGFLYTPSFSDVLIRDPQTLEVLPNGEKGIVQVMSVLPRSYPGHSLLTEDLGVIHGEADSPHGWRGKRLEVIGRLTRAELRGCSDTYAESEKGLTVG